FMNFETVLANECIAWDHPYSAGRSYAFIARSENLRDAFARGFNLIGLSNNHSRDCTRTGEGIDGEASTAAAAKSLLSDKTLLHGVTREPGGKQTPAIGRFSIKGRTVRVALGSAYVGRA